MNLTDGMNYLMRPCLSVPPLCTYQQLIDGTYDLADVAFFNEALDAREENNRRAHEAARDAAKD